MVHCITLHHVTGNGARFSNKKSSSYEYGAHHLTGHSVLIYI